MPEDITPGKSVPRGHDERQMRSIDLVQPSEPTVEEQAKRWSPALRALRDGVPIEMLDPIVAADARLELNAAHCHAVEGNDPEYFVRVLDGPEVSLLADVIAVADGTEMPLAALAESLRDWSDLDHDELADLSRCAVDTARTVQESLAACGRDAELRALAHGAEIGDEPRRRAVAELSPAERFLALIASERPRGWAAGSDRRHRQIENVRRRTQRHAEKLAEAVAE